MNLKRIRDLREDSDYTQEYIAHLLNISQRTYSRYETAERAIPLPALCFLADFYHTSVDYLLGRTDVRAPYPHPEGSHPAAKMTSDDKSKKRRRKTAAPGQN